MIEYRQGDILETDAEALVNTVNCVGVMGKGIALQFKQAYPDNFKDYEKACKKHQVNPGSMFIHPTGSFFNPKYIINFPTKKHWKSKSKLEDIKAGLIELIKEIRKLNIKSVAIPPLGCGCGGLDWKIVSKLIEEGVSELPEVKIYIFEPAGSPDPEKIMISRKKPALTRARALFISLIDNYATAGYRLSRLEIQKLAYFLQEIGEPLRLKFVKYHYGPYAHNLNHVLKNLEGHYIRGFGDGTSRAEEAHIYLLPGAVKEALLFLGEEPEAIERLKKVSEIIRGFENPHGLELLSTVHWVVRENPAIAGNPEKVIQEVKSWSKRKQKMFKDEHIKKVFDHLLKTQMIKV